MFGDTVMEEQTGTTSWWSKTMSNIGSALKTTVGALTPAAIALIQQKTAEKLGQAQVYQMQMTPAQNSPAAQPPATAKKLPSWLVPGAVGGALLIGGLLLMRKKR